jgi:hypothetical protein
VHAQRAVQQRLAQARFLDYHSRKCATNMTMCSQHHLPARGRPTAAAGPSRPAGRPRRRPPRRPRDRSGTRTGSPRSRLAPHSVPQWSLARQSQPASGMRKACVRRHPRHVRRFAGSRCAHASAVTPSQPHHVATLQLPCLVGPQAAKKLPLSCSICAVGALLVLQHKAPVGLDEYPRVLAR